MFSFCLFSVSEQEASFRTTREEFLPVAQAIGLIMLSLLSDTALTLLQVIVLVLVDNAYHYDDAFLGS